MNCIFIVLSILLLVLELSADSTESKISQNNKSFAEQFAGLLGVYSAVTVLKYISPVIVKVGFVPLFLITKLISKPLMLIGMTGWLMVAFIPLILARSGLTTPMFESRSNENQLFSSIGRLFSTNMSVVTTEMMNFFHLNNEECKLEMSCRLGKRMAVNIPYLQYFVMQSGAANWIDQTYMQTMFKSMSDPTDCQNLCPSLNTNHDIKYTTESNDFDNNSFEWFG